MVNNTGQNEEPQSRGKKKTLNTTQQRNKSFIKSDNSTRYSSPELATAMEELENMRELYTSAAKRHDKISNALTWESYEFEHYPSIFKDGVPVTEKEELLTIEELHKEKLKAQEEWVAAQEAFDAANKKVEKLQGNGAGKKNVP